MTNREIYNKIRTHNNEALKEYYTNLLLERARLGSKEAGRYINELNKSSKAKAF